MLKLPNSPWFDDESVKEIFQNNPNLGHLDLTDCSHLKNGSLQPLVINCKVCKNRKKYVFEQIHPLPCFTETRKPGFKKLCMGDQRGYGSPRFPLLHENQIC